MLQHSSKSMRENTSFGQASCPGPAVLFHQFYSPLRGYLLSIARDNGGRITTQDYDCEVRPRENQKGVDQWRAALKASSKVQATGLSKVSHDASHGS